MKRFLILLTITLTCLSLFASSAEARRFGGGLSFGKHRSFSHQQMHRAPSAAPGKTAGQQPRRNRWAGPLAGLAAGLGLGMLFSHLGLGNGMGMLLLIGLCVMAFMFLSSLLRRAQPRPAMQYAASDSYNRPEFTSGQQYAGGSSGTASQIPSDFPLDAFLRSAKTSFIRLQAANDRKDLDDIREYTTPEMFAEISMQMHERSDAAQKTDVLALDANMLEVVTEGNHAIGSVRLSGQLRENNGAPENFDEIWHVQKDLSDEHSVWLLAGIQQVA